MGAGQHKDSEQAAAAGHPLVEVGRLLPPTQDRCGRWGNACPRGRAWPVGSHPPRRRQIGMGIAKSARIATLAETAPERTNRRWGLPRILRPPAHAEGVVPDLECPNMPRPGQAGHFHLRSAGKKTVADSCTPFDQSEGRMLDLSSYRWRDATMTLRFAPTSHVSATAFPITSGCACGQGALR